MLQRLSLLLAIIGLWCLQGLLFAQEVVQMAAATHEPASWQYALLTSLVALVLCMVPLSMALVMVVERFPLVRGRLWRHGAVLLGAVLAFVALRAVYVWALNPIIGFYDDPPRFGEVLVASLHRNFLLGWIVVGLTHAWFLGRLAQRERERNAQLQGQLLQSRLDALSAQLNPHFLFNVLNSIAELLHVDTDAAERMILGLSTLLRRSLVAPLANEVRVGDELALVRDYLAIEQIRLGERLRVSMHMAAECADALLPPLLLQPLVENAIHHGIARRRAPGVLELDVRAAAAQLCIVVRADQAPGDAASARGHGIGLANVRERLACLYGTEAALQAEFPEGGRSCVTVRLPLRRAPASAPAQAAEVAA